MSRKVDVFFILKKHCQTLSVYKGGEEKISFIDIFSFFLLPALLGVLVALFSQGISDNILTLTVNFGAISTALLMSVLVLVYDQEAKIKDVQEKSRLAGGNADDKLVLLKELYQNICYTIVVSIVLVIFSVAGMSMVGEELSCFRQIGLQVTSGLVIAVFVNIVLTMLMVIKRFHALLTN